MRVLVTGASGFIGRQAVAALLARGFEVHSAGRRPPQPKQVVHHPADLLDARAMRAAVDAAAASHLLHLAWYVEPGAYWQSPRNLDWVAASLALVRAFRDVGGRRVVGAGTCAEYAWGAPVLREDARCDPASLYGASKDALRRVLTAFGEADGVSVAWGRVFYVFGPGEPAGRLVSGAIAALQAGMAFETSHGRQRRDFLHSADLGGAFAALVESGVVGPVNLGSGTAVPVRAILDTIAAAVGGPGRVIYGARALPASEPEVIEAAVERLRDEVGFRPRFDLAGGIADMVGSDRAPAR